MTSNAHTILVVDDDPGTRKSLGRILALDGFEVDHATSVAECLVERDWQRYTAVLLDRKLGDGNAEEALPAIKRAAPRLAIVVITGYADLESSVSAMRGGASDYLIKPINLDLLRATLARLRAVRDTEMALESSREARLQSEERLRLAVRATRDAIWDCDIVAGTLWRNRHYEESFGARPAPAHATCAWRLEDVHPDDRELVETTLREAIEGRNARWEASYRYQRTDGTWAYVADRAYIARDAAGRAIRVLGAMSDVTEQKELEAEFLQAQKMEAVGRLAGGIAHDFNNLLAGVLAACRIAAQGMPAASSARQVLEEAQAECLRGAQMTRQLLDFTRQGTREPGHTIAADVVAGTERVIRRLIGEDIELHVVQESGRARIWADPGRIEQALLNLAVNARDAMPGGGRLVFEVRARTIEAGTNGDGDPALAPGDYVVVSVTDTGEGMDEATRARAIEPFFTTKDVGKGTGLGLASVASIVKGAGGVLDLDSEPGRGTTVRMIFPRSADGAAPAAEAAAIEQGPHERGHQETVLVVEDERLIRMGIAALLRGMGYRTLLAASSAEALGMLVERSDPIDLLLTDVVLPGMSGPELVERMRETRPALRVVYMSGFTGASLEDQGRILSGERLLEKPFTEAELAEAVRDGLAGRRTTTPREAAG